MTKVWSVTRDKFLSLEEVKKLIGTLQDAKDLSIQRKKNYHLVRDYFILRTLLETGLRCFELIHLRVSDFVGKSIVVRCGKGGKPRTVLLTPETQKMLKEFIRLKRTLKESVAPEDFLFVSERKKAYTTNGIRKRVKYWFTRLGFNPKLSVHSCRHSYVSALFRAGLDLPTIMAQAGHSSVAVTNIYSHATRNDLEGFSLFSFENTKKAKLLEEEK